LHRSTNLISAQLISGHLISYP